MTEQSRVKALQKQLDYWRESLRHANIDRDRANEDADLSLTMILKIRRELKA